MNIDIETVTPSRIKLICAVSSEETQAEQDKVTKQFMATRALPGFRKGKAPREKIKKAFANEISMETTNNTVNAYYKKAVAEKQLKIYELVEFTDVKPSEDGGIAFTAVLDLEPKFELPEYNGIPVDNADTIITDEKVEEEFQSFRKSMAKFEDFTADSVAVTEDMLSVSYQGMVDGKPLAEVVPEAAAFSAKDNSWCTVGSEYFMIPGFPDAMVGMKLGAEGSLKVVFPDDFYKEELRGMAVDYTFTVKEGRHLVVPEINEEFLKSLHVETLEEFMTRIRTHLETQAKQQDKERRIRQIIDFLVKATPFELPQAEFERSTEDALNRLIQYGMRRGASKEDIAAEREKLMDTAKETADARMRGSFVIGKIGEILETKLTDPEFNAYLNEVFTRERLSEAQIKEIAKDRARLRMLYSEALKNKILEQLLTTAKPTGGISA